jgi:uncharacterized protein (DUF58 family)
VRTRLGWLRPALSGLTTRGRSFAAAGTAAGVCALFLGQRDLMRVAALLLVLPLAAALVLGRTKYRLALTRTISPPRVVAGTTARVRLEVENLTRVPTRVLLAEDHLPYTLGAAPRFVLAKLPGGHRAAVTYSVRPLVRGRFPIGPLKLQVTDPFGMCEVSRSFHATDPLVVVPRTWPLLPVDAGGQWAGTGDSVSRNAAASGADDVAIREYRYGDDLRRVHWKATAHRGELMVRRDEQPRQMRASVVLDPRLDAHRGEGSASSFEWAVSAAASIAVSLVEQKYGVRLLLDDRPEQWTTPYHADGGGQLLDRFAVLEPGSSEALAGALRTLAGTGGDGLVVAVLGEVDAGLATGFARLGRQGSRGIVLLLRTTAWATLPSHRAAELDAERAHVASILGSGGWSVAECSPSDTPASAWARAVGGSPVASGGYAIGGAPQSFAPSAPSTGGP